MYSWVWSCHVSDFHTSNQYCDTSFVLKINIFINKWYRWYVLHIKNLSWNVHRNLNNKILSCENRKPIYRVTINE